MVLLYIITTIFLILIIIIISNIFILLLWSVDFKLPKYAGIVMSEFNARSVSLFVISCYQITYFIVLRVFSLHRKRKTHSEVLLSRL